MNDSNPLTPMTEELLDTILFEKKKSRKTEKMGNDLPDGPKAVAQSDDEDESELDAEDTGMADEAAAPFTKDSPMAKGSPMSTDAKAKNDDDKDDPDSDEVDEKKVKEVNTKGPDTDPNDKSDAVKKLAQQGQSDAEKKDEASDWIQKAVNPKHKGYCTPMSKETCTPARKALAKRFKKAGRKEKKSGGTGWQGKV
tara:strand:+ start:1624 stop:2211 length:588 start_codon:yes stop_codon:yes gene_type:complete